MTTRTIPGGRVLDRRLGCYDVGHGESANPGTLVVTRPVRDEPSDVPVDAMVDHDSPSVATR